MRRPRQLHIAKFGESVVNLHGSLGLPAGGERLVIAAVTGWGSSEDKARARGAGFDHHLTKPVDLDAVERILRSVSPGDPATAIQDV